MLRATYEVIRGETQLQALEKQKGSFYTRKQVEKDYSDPSPTKVSLFFPFFFLLLLFFLLFFIFLIFFFIFFHCLLTDNRNFGY